MKKSERKSKRRNSKRKTQTSNQVCEQSAMDHLAAWCLYEETPWWRDERILVFMTMAVLLTALTLLIMSDEPRQERMAACRLDTVQAVCAQMQQEYVPASIEVKWCGTGAGCEVAFKCFDKEARVHQEYYLAPSEIEACVE